MLEFSSITKIVVTCKPCTRFTICFFLLKTEIHTQILNTEPILYNSRKSRYPQNKIGLLWYVDVIEPNFLSILNHCLFCKTIKINKLRNLMTNLNNLRDNQDQSGPLWDLLRNAEVTLTPQELLQTSMNLVLPTSELNFGF